MTELQIVPDRKDPRAVPRVLRGHVKRQLLQDLADGIETQSFLAEKYGVSHQAISQCYRSNKQAIDEIKAKRDDEMAGLWIANKQARVAEYEHDVEVLNHAMDGLPITDFMMRKHAALRAVAEELGQIPNKPQGIQAEITVKHEINGIDVSQLK